MTTADTWLSEHFYGTVTVGERGQVVIPAEARKQCGIEGGDKLLVFRHPKEGCFTLVKLEAARDFLNRRGSHGAPALGDRSATYTSHAGTCASATADRSDATAPRPHAAG